MNRDTTTPLMQQYMDIKARHRDAILFFRMGDFYEMFYEDAEVASRVLGLTLTSRNNGGAAAVPLAGVPARARDEYLRRFVQKGYRVAICEQVEDPKQAKGVVRREVVETVTPGAAFAEDLLEGTRNTFLVALQIVDAEVGIAAVDLSTGELRLATVSARDSDAVLARFSPRELLVPTGMNTAVLSVGLDTLIAEREPWEFDADRGRLLLSEQFSVQSPLAFGIGEGERIMAGAAGALLRYLRELQPSGLPHLARPIVERPGGAMPLDEMTRRNLELVEALRGGNSEGTLLAVIDRTQTSMGARLLRQWILAPLTDTSAIAMRHTAVGALAGDATVRQSLRLALDGTRDIERLSGKAATGRAQPRELRALGDSLARLPGVLQAIRPILTAGLLKAVAEQWDGCTDLSDAIGSTLVERPPISIGEGGASTITGGVDAELDELRRTASGGKDAIASLQAEERARTGIASLKVGYNRVFGYFIEVTNANAHLVPSDYQRRQTLTGAERYVTRALKEFEERVLHATELIEQLERTRFDALRTSVGREIQRLQHAAGAVAQLDVLATLGDVAAREGWVCPTMTDHFDLELVGARHPVVERMMPRDQFVPNDLSLARDTRVMILTGPNMAGKSTVLRQIGLIVVLAQAGSFVPAQSATIGIVDRVFTRVGASDNLVRGQSTFMVEMSETSAILHTATARSLVLLDEIGRGTSTWDGVSIAWAVTEHLHDRIGCKTVFATHYHELTQLVENLVSVRNYNVGVHEVGDRILFLHRLQPGGADRSYGIDVGRLAGLPAAVIARAREILRRLEAESLVEPRTPRPAGSKGVSAADQLALFAPARTHPLIERLRRIDVDATTPLEALTLLERLVAEARREDPIVAPNEGGG